MEPMPDSVQKRRRLRFNKPYSNSYALSSNFRRARVVVLIIIVTSTWMWLYFQVKRSYLGRETKLKISTDIVLIIQQFDVKTDDFHNTAKSWISALGGTPVLVFSEQNYMDRSIISPRSFPSVFREYNMNTVELEHLDYFEQIESKMALIVPENSRPPPLLCLRRVLKNAVESLNPVHILPGSQKMSCLKLRTDLRRWTIGYMDIGTNSTTCDSVTGRNAILIKSKFLTKIKFAFTSPFPEALFIQTASRMIKLMLCRDCLIKNRRNTEIDRHLHTTEWERRSGFYAVIEVKKLLLPDGRVEWYGCKKESQKCPQTSKRGSASTDMTRYTPPCCLEHLRQTLARAVSVLQEAGAKCWLEGETLSGAVQRNALLPWANHTEIGFDSTDTDGVDWLWKATQGVDKSAVDEEDFLWEYLEDYNYFRVAYSANNRMYVHVYPFRSDNGTMAMTFRGVQGQRDFPASMVQPVQYLNLSGALMPAPNRAQRFLRLKLGYNYEKNDGWN